MLLKKKVITFLVAFIVLTAGAVIGGTALEINQPVSAMVTIANLGDAVNGPSFNIIDNVFSLSTNAKAGASAGYIDSQDNYIIGFGAGNPGGSWALKFGRSQTATVGNANDYVFSIKNSYDNAMTISLDELSSFLNLRGRLGNGAVIKVVNAATDAAQWTMTGAVDSRAWTITGTSLVLNTNQEATFYMKVENSNAVAGTWDPKIRFTATAQ